MALDWTDFTWEGSGMSGFKKFLLRGNVVDLAVAVVVGAAFKDVVDALVKNFITPLIGAFGGVPDFSALAFTLNNSRFGIGAFVNAVVAFLIIAVVIYFFVVLPVNALMERFKTEEAVGPPQRECPHCLSKIPVAAGRCAFCCQAVPTVETATQPAASGG
jgi:large conductance mechanosensitive channel